MRRSLALAVVVLTAGCKSTAPVRPPAAPAPPAPATSPTQAAATPKTELPDALHWFRNSAERRAIALQTYRWAAERIEKAAQGREAGSWAVILDADETILDNSAYEVDLLQRRITHTPELWSAWVSRKAAPAIPGAAGFIGRVRSLGGRVAIVTNRSEAECPDTGANLASVGVSYDAILCRPTERSEKGTRFEKVARGEAFSDGKPVEVLMWVGDNIQDFPGLTQAIRKQPEDALAPFGSRFIVLPNPMYGSWEKNPQE
jgi:5'-nucleotidase (lipoprotein e(P4) family)